MVATVEVPIEIESFRNARVRVIVERAPYADARAELVFEKFIDNVEHEHGSRTHIPCEINLSELSDWSSLIVRAHIDLDGDGQISKGDLLSQRAYPLVAHIEEIIVVVEKVGR